MLFDLNRQSRSQSISNLSSEVSKLRTTSSAASNNFSTTLPQVPNTHKRRASRDRKRCTRSKVSSSTNDNGDSSKSLSTVSENRSAHPQRNLRLISTPSSKRASLIDSVGGNRRFSAIPFSNLAEEASFNPTGQDPDSDPVSSTSATSEQFQATTSSFPGRRFTRILRHQAPNFKTMADGI